MGQGSAAFAAAIKANGLGKKTVMIGKNATEGTTLGGTCLNVGCVPSKRLITVASFLESLKDRRFRGIDYKFNGDVELGAIVKEKDDLVNGFRQSKYSNVLAGLENVTYIEGFGSLKSPNIVSVGKKEILAKKILIATGARASVPDVKGIEDIEYLTNETALKLKKLPKSMIVVGGRALGLEFAQMFNRFGSKVTLLQRSSTIIPGWEPEIINHLTKYLREEGINIQTNVTLNEIEGDGGAVRLKCEVDGKASVLEAEKVLFATGRKPNIEKLNLDTIGIRQNKAGFVEVDRGMRTNIEGVYAAGDVTGEPMLETLAAKEGTIATLNALDGAKKEINLLEVPKAIFTDPEAASVGLTDEEAAGKKIRCNCNALPLELVAKAGIVSDTKGVIKIVIDNKSHKILGVHMLAPHAADLIHEGVLAIKFGLTIDDIIDTVHVFPTLSEGFKLAAQAFYQDISKLSCCTE